MSSTVLNAINNIAKDKHGVGSLNNMGHAMVNLGAVVASEAIDNWEIVKLGFDAEGNQTCEILDNEAEAGYLIASVEDYMEEYETISNFYNAKGEKARIVVLEKNKRFETSLYVLDDESKPVKNGMVAHWDVTKRRYVISNGASESAGYAGAGNKFVVVDAEGNYFAGQHTIRFAIA